MGILARGGKRGSTDILEVSTCPLHARMALPSDFDTVVDLASPRRNAWFNTLAASPAVVSILFFADFIAVLLAVRPFAGSQPIDHTQVLDTECQIWWNA